MNRRNRFGSLCAAVGLLAAASAVRAEDAAPKAAAAPSRDAMTLDRALARAAPPKEGVALAVDAGRVPLPPGAVLPGDTPTVPEVGALYGRTVLPFGAVQAVAAPTITVVYAPPETPNPYDGMPPGQVMSLLCKTFTPPQWKAFLSRAGVAYADMAGPTQPALFQALFPEGHLKVIRDNPAGDNDPKSARDLSGDALAAAHLRLGYTVSLALQQEADPNGHLFANGLRPANSPARYFMTNSREGNVDRELGAAVRETVPNALKAGDLAFDAPALKLSTLLSGVRTVDDLVTRIGLTTRLELYADARYGARPVTVSPPNGSAPAADLLRAVALCVGGTYRRVGPAWVLTDDTVGLGTKHALWKAFEEKAQAMLPGGGDVFSQTAGEAAGVPYTVRDIPFGDDPLAFTPAQDAQYWKEWEANPMQGSSGMRDITLPYAKLSPAQREAAELIQAANEKSGFRTTLGGTVMVQAEPEVEVVLPGLDGPALIFQSYQSLLPEPALAPAAAQARRKKIEAEFPEMAAPAPPATDPDLPALLAGFARRAARVAPKTEKETRETFAALKTLGFTEAWLQTVPDPSVSDADARARLARAVAEGHTLGLAVLPDLSLLRWEPKRLEGKGADRTDDLVDRDLQGRPGSPETVSPFAPAVASRLTALVRTLGSVPGLSGMVWEDGRPPGYEASVPGESVGDWGDPLGYGGAGRLAFLRSAHADPVDLYTTQYTDERAHVVVPGFSDDFKHETRLFGDWRKARADAADSLTRRLAAALPASFTSAAPRLPLLLTPSNAGFASSLGSWDDLSRPAPGVRFVSPAGPDGRPMMGVPSVEKMASALVYAKLPMYLPPSPPLRAWKAEAARALGRAKARGDRNVLVDLTGQPELLREALAPKDRKK